MSDASYFEADLVDRLRARGRQIRERIAATLRFHTAYQKLLLGDDGKLRPEVLPALRDLRAFCFAEATTFHQERDRAAANVGRREVWLRIERGLRFDRKKLEALNRQLQEDNDDD